MKENKIRLKKPIEEVNSMELLKVKRHFQVTIPASLRAKLQLAEGDYVQADVEEGKIVIRPVEVIHPGQGKRRSMTKEREAAYALLDEIHAQMKDEDPEEIEKAIAEAVKEARKQ